jgi:hypothetical protein
MDALSKIEEVLERPQFDSLRQLQFDVLPSSEASAADATLARIKELFSTWDTRGILLVNGPKRDPTR